MSSPRITHVEARLLPLTLGEPYAIAYQSIERFDNVLLHLVTDTGHHAFGVAAPDPDITGESAAQSLAALCGPIRDAVLGEDGLRRTHLVERARALCPQLPAARAALDMALVDLLGLVSDLPAWRLLGGYHTALPTSVTIGILDLPATLEAARRRLAEGFSILKIKGGLDLELDLDRLRALRALAPEIELRFDANGGYTLDQALDFARAAKGLDISIFEQPTRTSPTSADLGHLTLTAPMSIMADESLQSARDCFRLGAPGFGPRTGPALVDMINIKLMKVGGLDDAFQVNAIARAAGIEAMVGCMDECELSIAASLALALSRKNVTAVDLDGHLDLLDDPTAGTCLHLERGQLTPSPHPGLGLSPSARARLTG